MRKTKLTALLLCAGALLGCSPNLKKMSEADAKAYGVKLITNYFENILFTNRFDVENEVSKYSLTLDYTRNNDDISLINALSDSFHYYNYRDNEVTVLDVNKREVERFSLSRDNFIHTYLGLVHFDFAENEIKTHLSIKDRYYFAKGNGSYYVLDQNIVFNTETQINLQILNTAHNFFVNELSFQIKAGKVEFVRFHGHQIIEDEPKPLLFFVDIFPG